MTSDARPVFATRDDVDHAAENGVDTALLLTTADTAGRSTAREILCDPGATIATIEDETAHRYVFVVAGDWTMTVGGDTRACTADTMIQLPAGLSASAQVTGREAGKLLVVTLPPAGPTSG